MGIVALSLEMGGVDVVVGLAVAPVLGGSLDDAVNSRQGRWVTPAEVARVILHLTSDDAIMTNGIAYTIDNAMTASLF